MSELESLLAAASRDISAAPDVRVLEEVRVRLLGKKGVVTGLLKGLGQLAPEARREQGARINAVKERLLALLDVRQREVGAEQLQAELDTDRVDVTLPGRREATGGLHPITLTLNRIESIFARAGYDVVDGPEVEDDYHNFEALNIPAHHPARAMHDTFYLGDENTLLR